MSFDWEKLRKEEWPVLETMTFLDAACVSFAPQRIVNAVKDFADMTARQDEESSGAHHLALDAVREKAYEEAAKLLNADLDEIALVESTTHGLNIAARGMDEEGMEQYLDTFKHGMPPHGGLGIGLERLTMQILGEENVRETCLFPRDMNRLEP